MKKRRPAKEVREAVKEDKNPTIEGGQVARPPIKGRSGFDVNVSHLQV